MVKVAVVITVAPGRLSNLLMVLDSLHHQTRQPDMIVIVDDGGTQHELDALSDRASIVKVPKHEPGLEQPRNAGTRVARDAMPELTHTWFLDSDVMVACDALEQLEIAAAQNPTGVVAGPYQWLPDGFRPSLDMLPSLALEPGIHNDQRWEMFQASPTDRLYRADLSAGLACFGGNLLWNIDEFQRVGGFWAEIHHGRCEDGELGLRAVAMDVPISFCIEARGYHLAHPINMDLAIERNTRDVPMLNARHAWVQDSTQVFMVDRDGAAFDVACRCGDTVPTIGWWAHAAACEHTGLSLPVH